MWFFFFFGRSLVRWFYLKPIATQNIFLFKPAIIIYTCWNCPSRCADGSLVAVVKKSSWLFLFFDIGGDAYPEDPIAPVMAAFAACWIYAMLLPWSPWNRACLSSLPSKFLQSMHLQFSEQRMLAWKHSQYFLRHPDFLQWHPLLCFPNIKTSPASSCIYFKQLSFTFHWHPRKGNNVYCILVGKGSNLHINKVIYKFQLMSWEHVILFFLGNYFFHHGIIRNILIICNFGKMNKEKHT